MELLCPVPAPCSASIPIPAGCQVVSDLEPNKMLSSLQQPSTPLSMISYIMQDGGGEFRHALLRPARPLLLLVFPLGDCRQKRIHRLS